MNSEKTVLFDLDGTLLNTLGDLTASTNAAMEKMGFATHTLDDVRRFVGNGIGLLIARSIPGGKENPKYEETLQVFREHYGAHCLDTTQPYPGVMEMLHQLQANGVKMGILSNKADFAVKSLCQRFFGPLVPVAVGERPGVRRKPAPDAVLACMEELKSDAAHTVYVGDSDVDIETARNAGLRCLSCTWGFRDRAFLLEHGATTLVDTPKALLEEILK
ncbi:MAG TPA: HAD family hydrolase [Firmicutes bacterium]|nr:HAD family hydrolase [Bacillota bacterium]